MRSYLDRRTGMQINNREHAQRLGKEGSNLAPKCNDREAVDWTSEIGGLRPAMRHEDGPKKHEQRQLISYSNQRDLSSATKTETISGGASSAMLLTKQNDVGSVQFGNSRCKMAATQTHERSGLPRGAKAAPQICRNSGNQKAASLVILTAQLFVSKRISCACN